MDVFWAGDPSIPSSDRAPIGGVVRPEWFTDVDFFDDGKITAFEARLLKVYERSANQEEANRRMTVRTETA